MALHTVTLPSGGPTERSLLGFARPFRAGIPQDLDLTDGQVQGLRAKGFDVRSAAEPREVTTSKPKHVSKSTATPVVEE